MTALLLPVVLHLPAAAQESDSTKLAKAAQNPVADMISVPFQYNANFGTGPESDTQHLLNIQPVYPLGVNADWNLITRTIIPLLSQPAFAAGEERVTGLGDIQPFVNYNFPQHPLQASAYYNLEKPEVVGADWQLRMQMALLFPK